MVICPTLLSFISGVPCPPAVPLDFDNTEKNICEKLREKPEENLWHQIKCWRFKTQHSWLSMQFKRCSEWCVLLDRCFNENATRRWEKHCSAMFRRPFPSQISAARDNASFHVHPCPRKTEYAVRMSSCNCSENSSDTRK